MIVKSLANTSFETVLECFLASFENYYVKMPTDPDYYKKRWAAAKVDFSLSYGMFDGDQLVGFIIHAVDNRFGKQVAYNTGTGVIPTYRRKRIVKSIYDFAIKDLVKNGIEKTTLEVITLNEFAIKAYRGAGFQICKNYKCYEGDIKLENIEGIEVSQLPIKEIDWDTIPRQEYYSWDFQRETIRNANYEFYQVHFKQNLESFFFIDKEKLMLGQWDLYQEKENAWKRLFISIQNVTEKIRIINLDTRMTDKVKFIEKLGLKNTVDQFEMELLI